MSKLLQPFSFSLSECERELDDLGTLLATRAELSESENILPFFRAHSHLAALAGSLNPHLSQFDLLSPEFDLFGNFRCDWVVGDSQSQSYTLIEFEDARANSIFEGGQRYQDCWGRRFEHGFSQLVDWLWALDAYRGNPDLIRRFGTGPLQFTGLLVIGRRQFLQTHHVERLRWRLDRVLINSHKVVCFTFDDLYDFLRTRVNLIRSLALTSGPD
ncbi:MAG: Shedu immune nuclease family protein [Actinomycetota bacterium]